MRTHVKVIKSAGGPVLKGPTRFHEVASYSAFSKNLQGILKVKKNIPPKKHKTLCERQIKHQHQTRIRQTHWNSDWEFKTAIISVP